MFRSPRRGIFALAAMIATVAWPLAAWACPACLGAETRNATFLKVGSLFVLLPFAVVALVLYVLRQAPERG
jgi:hypothetical protein